jgi:hypothetical protein
MANLLCNRWFTALRVFLIGGLAALIFSASPAVDLTAEGIATAVLSVIAGVMIGFWLAARPGMIAAISKLGGHYYSLMGALGFVFAALWAAETGILWPLLAWFVPASVLESFVSSIGLARRRRAS